MTSAKKSFYHSKKWWGKDGKMNDMLPFMLMGGFGANPNGCCGNCSCDKDK